MTDKTGMRQMTLRQLLYQAIRELEYVQCAEDHSLCASAMGVAIIEAGMEALGVKDLSAESIER